MKFLKRYVDLTDLPVDFRISDIAPGVIDMAIENIRTFKEAGNKSVIILESLAVNKNVLMDAGFVMASDAMIKEIEEGISRLKRVKGK